VGAGLASPPYNVAKMKKILGDCKFGEDETEFIVINTLIGEEATKEAILTGIASTFEGADDNDVNYFYWNGHGSATKMPHIAPSDFKSRDETTWLTVDELEHALSAAPGTKVVFLDTCYSGGFIGKGFVKSLLVSDDYQVITSCRGDQLCYENPNASIPYCYFTMGVYQACTSYQYSDLNKDGIINLTELWSYVYNWVNDHGYHCKCHAVYTQYFPEGSTFPIIEY